MQPLHDPRFGGVSPTPITFTPIGVVRSPFTDKVSAPRQPAVSRGTPGTIELYTGRGFEHAVSDLEGWGFIWVLFVFDRNTTWHPKVLPPRSTKRRGVFSTRSPHRPNSIGLSVLKLVGVDGLTIRVEDLDILDGTPVLDVKPYVAYVDAIPNAASGWLEGELSPTGAPPPDPAPTFDVTWEARAVEQTAWLLETYAIDLAAAVTQLLALGPQPHPYRRIRAHHAGGFRLAWKDWRVFFELEGNQVTVRSVASGYRTKELASDDPNPELVPHRAFVTRF